MKVHSLKTWDSHWLAVCDGSKTFEIRFDDRDYAVNDLLLLRRFDPTPGASYGGYVVGDQLDYTKTFEECAQTIRVEVTYIFHGGRMGLDDGYVVLGIRKVDA